MTTTIPKLPCINFPMGRQYPEPDRMRALIDRYGDNPLFLKKHNEAINLYIEAVHRWLPLYQGGRPQPDLPASWPELMGWGAYLRFQAVLKVEFEKLFFWDLMLKYLHRDYLERVLGIAVTAEDITAAGIFRPNYISPKKYHHTTHSIPGYRDGLNMEKLKSHAGRIEKHCGSTKQRAFNELEGALWYAVSQSPDPEIRALRDEYQEFVVSLNDDHRNGTAVPRTTFCPYCKKLLEWTPAKGIRNIPLSCGSAACKKTVERDRKREYRTPSPPESLFGVRRKCLVCLNRRKIQRFADS